MADAQARAKKAHFAQLGALTKGQFQTIPQVEWAKVMEILRERSMDELTIDGVIYQPGLCGDVAVLGIHRPINTDFLSRIDNAASKVVDLMQDDQSDDGNQLPNFAHSTAVAFAGRGNVVVHALGSGTSSPRVGTIIPFLEKFQPFDDSATHWHQAPVWDEARVKEFARSKGAISFSTRFTTARDLLDQDDATPAGLISYSEDLANDIDADLDIEISVRLAAGNTGTESRKRLLNLVKRDLPILVRNRKSKTKATAVTENGSIEDLNLVADHLRAEFEVAPDKTERGRFSQLLEGVSEQAGAMDTRLKEILEG